MNKQVEQISPRELQKRLEKNSVKLIDVREQREWDYCRIEGAELIPVQQVADTDIDAETDDEIVCYCHTGQRSYFAAQILQRQGFENVYNLKGGINACSDDVDPSIPKY
ncbi:MAG: putative adenylyltransferase/sulfurtransferase MoeZ [Candidatus Marinimicrobia bacterium]|nr:putative adenylyltransferase/sulfurtransferase MoeZ [Candidatus Neomarinimicrobiota bacterium]